MSEDDEIFSLLDKDDDGPQGRCEQCKLVYGKPQKHNESVLRCAGCDFPFGETFEGVRAIALALQELKTEDYWDVYSQKVCYVWMRLVRDGLDLTCEPYGYTDTLGTTPEWLDYELSNSGWGDIINPGYHSHGDSDFDGTWNTWALENGICPNQPFLVEMKPPRWYKCSYEYEEWDVEYDFDIVMLAKRSPKQAALAWERWKKQCARNRQDVRKAHERAAYRRTHDVAAMYLSYDTWGMNPYVDYGRSDEGGYIVALGSKHGGGWFLQGRSPNYDERWKKKVEREEPSYDRAMIDLLDQIQKHLPHLDPEVIRKLPRR